MPDWWGVNRAYQAARAAAPVETERGGSAPAARAFVAVGERRGEVLDEGDMMKMMVMMMMMIGA